MKYLKAGVMVNGVLEKTEVGTPQGGNLSPLLSNIMLCIIQRSITNLRLKKRGLLNPLEYYLKVVA